MNAHVQRAMLLAQQGRHKMADDELRGALAQDPYDPFAHALLGLCLAEDEDFDGALNEVRQAIHIAPDFPYAHYAHAHIHILRERSKEALPAAQEAVRLDPGDPDYHAELAAVHLMNSDWKLGLECAERALQLDGEHVRATNLRAMALTQLGRRAEAGLTIDTALSRNPDNALTHANQGWTLLHKGEPKKALEHFREAMRLDPTNDWARQGIVEAMKARIFIYRWILKYFLWMGRLKAGSRWGVAIGAWLGFNVLLRVEKQNPEYGPYLWPLLYAYLAFVLMSWLAQPLFNSVLRISRYGRHALTSDQTFASNCILGLLLFSGGALLADWRYEYWLLDLSGYYGLWLVIPVAGTFTVRPGRGRRVMWLYTAGLFVIAVAVACIVGFAPLNRYWVDWVGTLAPAFFWGCALSMWVSNFAGAMRPSK
ncbi:MAG: tetratricopeptide repeat protein [Planctomycetes bacterium]|nr:tetratricopeptide repeat protein [Planctomycetota bacterium]